MADEMRNAGGRFQPGHPKTPGCGRTKGRKSLSDALWRVCSDETPNQEELTDICDQLEIPPYMRDEIAMAPDRQEVFARVMVRLALLGDINMVREIFDRLDPKRKEISGPGGAPIRTQALALVGNTDPAAAKLAYDDLLEQEGVAEEEIPD